MFQSTQYTRNWKQSPHTGNNVSSLRTNITGEVGRFVIFRLFKSILFLKCLGSQVAADEGCERDVVHRMNEGYSAWGALKSVLSNRGLGIKAKKCLYEEVIAPGVVRSRGMGYEKC